jgi:hypothetical protein
MVRNGGQLARYAATRVVGLTALSGLAALALNAWSATSAEGAPKAVHTPPVTTSATFTVELHVSMPTHYALDLHASGQADFVHHDVALNLEIPTAGLHASDIVKGVAAATGLMDLHVEWVSGKGYLTVPAALSTLAGGAQALSYAVPAATVREVNTAITQTAVAITYAHILLNTMAAHAAQHHVGTKRIEGASATGTEVDLTLSQLLKVVPGLTPEMTRDAAQMGNTKIPVTVWVDQAGRLVEATMATTKSSTGSISGTVQFSKFNAPVSIAAPAAGTVKPVSKEELSLLQTLNPFGDEG